MNFAPNRPSNIVYYQTPQVYSSQYPSQSSYRGRAQNIIMNPVRLPQNNYINFNSNQTLYTNPPSLNYKYYNLNENERQVQANYLKQPAFINSNKNNFQSNIKKKQNYNTYERISQQAEYLQTSVRNRASNNQEGSSFQLKNSQKQHKPQFQYNQDDSFANYFTKPQPIYCVLCERYYQIQEQIQHLQKHRKVKNYTIKNKPIKQLNQKVTKFDKRIPISIPTEYNITQNICQMNFKKQKKDADVNTSESQFILAQNKQTKEGKQKDNKYAQRQQINKPQIKIHEQKQVQQVKQFILFQQKRSLSNKSVPFKIKENMKQQQILQNNIKKSKQLNNQFKKQDFNSQIQIDQSEYNLSDKQSPQSYARNILNKASGNDIKLKNKQQQHLNLENKNKNSGQINQNTSKFGIKPSLKIPLQKVDKPIYNQSYYQQSIVQLQPTQLNFDDEASQKSKQFHKSQKNFTKNKNDIPLNLSDRKPSSQLKIQKSQEFMLNNQAQKNGKTMFKKKQTNLDQQIQSSLEKANSKIIVGNIQIESCKQTNKNCEQNSKHKNANISKKSNVRMVDTGVGGNPIQFQSPGPSKANSTSSKKQRVAKNMLINQPI